jgi:hypothetical protein
MIFEAMIRKRLGGLHPIGSNSSAEVMNFFTKIQAFQYYFLPLLAGAVFATIASSS